MPLYLPTVASWDSETTKQISRVRAEPNLPISTPVVQTFKNPVTESGGIEYRAEKAVTMGPNGVKFDHPVDGTVQLSPLAEGEKVYLVNTSNNEDIEWSEEEA